MDMKAAYFMGNKTFEIKECEIPKAEKDWVVVQNEFCGVCGTDVHIYHGEPGSADVNPPVVLGHEYSGIVTEIGEGVTNVKVGDHVTIDPNIYCGQCNFCRDGKKQMCESMEAVGVTMNGGFAQYSTVPKAQAFKLQDDVPFEAGAMAEPVACCIHGIDLAGIKAGDNVCVVGGGAIGLIMVQLAKLSGAANVILSEPNALRRKIALELGADLTVDPVNEDYINSVSEFIGEDGADVVIECVGNNRAVQSAFDLSKKGATVLLFSVPKVDAEFGLKLFDVFKKELTIKGSFVNPETHSRAVKLINSGKLDLMPIITHRFPVEGLEDAIKTQMGSESIKVLVEL